MSSRNKIRFLDALIRFPLLAIAVTLPQRFEQALGCTGKLRGVNALELVSPAGFEPAVSTLKGSRARPLHHGDVF